MADIPRRQNEIGNVLSEDNDPLRLRGRLIQQAERTLRDIAYHVGAPPLGADYAIHRLRRLLAKRFRNGGGLEGVGFLQSYFNEAARSALRSAFKRARSWLPASEAGHLFAIPPALCRRRFSYEEIMVKLAEVLKAISPSELKVMDLARRGYTPGLIAITLGMTADSVRAQQSTARRKIREIFRRRDSA